MRTKTKVMSYVLSAMMIVSAIPATSFADDETQSPTIIKTVDELMAVKDNLGGNFILNNDIDLEGAEWTPLGTCEMDPNDDGETPLTDQAFHGTFDGDGHTISNYKIVEKQGTLSTGFFGTVAEGTVKNLKIKDVSITGNCMVAGAVGYSFKSTIDDVDLSGKNTMSLYPDEQAITGEPANMAAGVIGAISDSTVKNCDVDGLDISVKGCENAQAVGMNAHDIGIVTGGLEASTLENSTAKNGTITFDSNDKFVYGIGGVSGCAFDSEYVKDCSAENITITLGDNAYLVGGVVGYSGTLDNTNPTKITGCSTDVAITVGANPTRIGSIVGGGFYLDGMGAYAPLPAYMQVKDCQAQNATYKQVGYATFVDDVDEANVETFDKVFADGDGTAQNPYQIASAQALYAMRFDLTANYKLVADIDVGSYFDMDYAGTSFHTWSPIGSYVPFNNSEAATLEYAFTGTFDGDGYTVSNITVDSTTPNDSMESSEKYGTFGIGGLFGCISNATVKNVNVQNVNIKGFALVAGVIGYAENNSVVENVNLVGSADSHNTVECTAMMAGGIIGGAMESTFKDSKVEYTDVIVGMVGNTGAFGGGISHSSVINCVADNCTVTADNGGVWIGGFAGCVNYGDAKATDYSFKDCTVSNTVVTVNGKASYVGGLVGAGGCELENDSSDREVIDCCKVENTKVIVSEDVENVGAIVGGGLTDTDENPDATPNSFAIKNCTVTGATIETKATDLAKNGIGKVIGESNKFQFIDNNGKKIDIKDVKDNSIVVDVTVKQNDEIVTANLVGKIYGQTVETPTTPDAPATNPTTPDAPATNPTTPDAPVTNPTTPATGGTSNSVASLSMMFVAIAALGVIANKKKKV